MNREVIDDSVCQSVITGRGGISYSKSSPFSTTAFFEKMENITATHDQFLISASGELQKHIEAHQPAIQFSKRATKRTESPSRVDSSDHESVTCRSPDLCPRQPLNIHQSCFSTRLEDLYDQLLSKLQYMQVHHSDAEKS